MPKSSGSWKPGQSGNPAGRPLGSKDAITKAFLDTITADFEKHGAAVVEGARERNPNEYLRVIASILPKDQNLRVQTDELSDRFKAMLERRDGAEKDEGLGRDAELAKEIARLKEENAALRGDDTETDTARH